MVENFVTTAEFLTAEAFAPFGEVISGLEAPGRKIPAAELLSLRPAAKPILGISHIAAITTPLFIRRIERHLHSSQTFIPLGNARFIVVVAAACTRPPAPNQFRAFLASSGQAVSYAPGTWHHPLVAIGESANFVSLIWRAGDDEDEQFAEVDPPFEIALPD